MAHSAASRNERINLRLDADAKRRIERAASFEGRSVSSFVLDSALSSADKAIREHERMVLSRQDVEVFFDAILNPLPTNEALQEAMEEYRERVTSR